MTKKRQRTKLQRIWHGRGPTIARFLDDSFALYSVIMVLGWVSFACFGLIMIHCKNAKLSPEQIPTWAIVWSIICLLLTCAAFMYLATHKGLSHKKLIKII